MLCILPPSFIIFPGISSPEIKNRYSGQYNNKTRERISGFVDKQYYHYDNCSQYIQSGYKRIAKSLVGPWYIRAFYPQDENGEDSKRKEDKHRKDHKIEQITVCA